VRHPPTVPSTSGPRRRPQPAPLYATRHVPEAVAETVGCVSCQVIRAALQLLRWITKLAGPHLCNSGFARRCELEVAARDRPSQDISISSFVMKFSTCTLVIGVTLRFQPEKEADATGDSSSNSKRHRWVYAAFATRAAPAARPG
jgi:hypothetical protein